MVRKVRGLAGIYSDFRGQMPVGMALNLPNPKYGNEPGTVHVLAESRDISCKEEAETRLEAS